MTFLDFSFDEWIQDKVENIEDGSLSDIVQSQLFDVLGITPYLFDDECSVVIPTPTEGKISFHKSFIECIHIFTDTRKRS